MSSVGCKNAPSEAGGYCSSSPAHRDHRFSVRSRDRLSWRVTHSETLELALSRRKVSLRTVKGYRPTIFPRYRPPNQALHCGSTRPSSNKWSISRRSTSNATDDSRPVLAGVSIAIGPGEARYVFAKCGRLGDWRVKTLQTQRQTSPEPLQHAVQIVVPRNSMLELISHTRRGRRGSRDHYHPRRLRTSVFNVGSVQMDFASDRGPVSDHYEQLVPNGYCPD